MLRSPSQSKQHLIAFVIIALATGSMLALTWKTWPDTIYDFGSQLYYPWQMCQGRHLYVDIAYFNGPLSQYFNATLFQIFGDSLNTLIIANLLITLGVTALIYSLVVKLSGIISATCACCVFLFLFGFSQYVSIGNYNWLCPYPHELTHGVALSLAMIAILRSCTRRSLILAGVLLGLVFWTKAEVFVPAAVAAAVGLALRLRPIYSQSSLHLLYWFFGAAIGVILAAFLFLAATINQSVALRAIAGSWPWIFDRRIAQLQFYRQGLGIDAIGDNLWRMSVIGVASAVVLATLFAIAKYSKPIRALAIGLLAIEMIAMLCYANWFLQVARPWPLMVLIIAAISIRIAWQKNRADHAASTTRAMLAVFAFVLLGKMLLNARLWQYGFALAMPAAVVLAEAIVGWWANPKLRWAGVAVVITVVICVFSNQSRPATIAVGAGKDQFFADARGQEINEALKYIEYLNSPTFSGRPEGRAFSLIAPQARPSGPPQNQRVNTRSSLAVMPQGLMLNYLSRSPAPTPCVNFMPPEVISLGEDHVVEQLNAHPPDWVVLSEKDIRDGSFILTEGTYHYGSKILSWVLQHYQQVIPANPQSQLKLSYWKRVG